MTSPSLTLFHNPKCSTSRKVLDLLRGAGADPTVVDYLKAGWTEPQLQALLKTLGAAPRDILRTKEPLVKDLGLDQPEASDADILAAMIAHPVLVERPIVVSPKGGAVCRPVERALALI